MGRERLRSAGAGKSSGLGFTMDKKGSATSAPPLSPPVTQTSSELSPSRAPLPAAGEREKKASAALREVPVEDLLAGPEQHAGVLADVGEDAAEYLRRCGAPMM